jgi:hypothetical protein
MSAARWLAGKSDTCVGLEGAGPGEGARRAFIRAAWRHRMNAREWSYAHVRHVPNRRAPTLQIHAARQAEAGRELAREVQGRP